MLGLDADGQPALLAVDNRAAFLGDGNQVFRGLNGGPVGQSVKEH